MTRTPQEIDDATRWCPSLITRQDDTMLNDMFAQRYNSPSASFEVGGKTAPFFNMEGTLTWAEPGKCHAFVVESPDLRDRQPITEINFDASDFSGEKHVKLRLGIDWDYEVKSWTNLFEAFVRGDKRHDMRDKRDRDYAVRDRMLMREYDMATGLYTGRWAIARITYVTSNDTPCAMSSAALDRNFAILSIERDEWSK